MTARTAFEAENSPGSCCRTAERHRDCLAGTAFLRWFPEANKQSPSLPSVYGVVFAILVRGAIAKNEIRPGATTHSIADCSIRPSSRRLRTGANLVPVLISELPLWLVKTKRPYRSLLGETRTSVAPRHPRRGRGGFATGQSGVGFVYDEQNSRNDVRVLRGERQGREHS